MNCLAASGFSFFTARMWRGPIGRLDVELVPVGLSTSDILVSWSPDKLPAPGPSRISRQAFGADENLGICLSEKMDVAGLAKMQLSYPAHWTSKMRLFERLVRISRASDNAAWQRWLDDVARSLASSDPRQREAAVQAIHSVTTASRSVEVPGSPDRLEIDLEEHLSEEEYWGARPRPLPVPRAAELACIVGDSGDDVASARARYAAIASAVTQDTHGEAQIVAADGTRRAANFVVFRQDRRKRDIADGFARACRKRIWWFKDGAQLDALPDLGQRLKFAAPPSWRDLFETLTADLNGDSDEPYWRGWAIVFCIGCGLILTPLLLLRWWIRRRRGRSVS